MHNTFSSSIEFFQELNEIKKSDLDALKRVIQALDLFLLLPGVKFSSVIYFDSSLNAFQRIYSTKADEDLKEIFIGIPFPHHFRFLPDDEYTAETLAKEYRQQLNSETGKEFLVNSIGENNELLGMLVIVYDSNNEQRELVEQSLLLCEPLFQHMLLKLDNTSLINEEENIFLRHKLAELVRALVLNDSIDDISAIVLKYAKELTGSRFGYVGYIEEDSGFLVAPTMTRDIWKKCEVKDKSIIFKEFGGLWGWVLDNKKAMYTNDPENDKRSTGTPKGHILISNFISVPVMAGEKLLGQIALANSSRHYNDFDISILEELGFIYAIAIDKLRKYENLLIREKTLDSAINPIAIFDENGLIQYSNNSFKNLLGLSITEAIQKLSIKDFFLHTENFYTIIEKLKKGNQYFGELKMKAAGDSVIDVILTASALHNEDGSIRFFQFALMDLSEILSARAEVRKSEEIFRKVWEKSLDAMRIVNKDGIIQLVNNAYCKLVDKQKNQLLGKSFSLVYEADEQKRVLSTFRERYEKGEFKDFYITKITLWNKNQVWLSITHSFIEIPNEMPFFLNIFRDITAAKQSEEKIRNYTIELEEINSNKNKLFSIISHDLRSPFHGLIGITDNLLKKYPEISEKKLSKHLSLIHKTLRNLFELTENVLNWSRLKNGEIVMEPESLQLSHEIGNAIALLKVNAEIKNIQMINNAEESIRTSADKKMLNSVLQNLLNNAIKFTKNGGWVKIETEVLEKECLIKIEDNGMGIKPELQKNIFNLSLHESNPGTNDESGTGFGLYICREFIERMQGKISLESRPGVGTVVSFTLPLSP